MNQPMEPMPSHEPSLHTVEMVCDRLAELGLAVGPDTARELVRAVLAAEAPRVDARLREALDTALQTIRVAAQSAMGVLATTTPAESRPRPDVGPRAEPRPAAPPRRTPAAGRPAIQRRAEAEPPARRPAESDDVERRPIFRRPRGR
jgi:hypothetical protein